MPAIFANSHIEPMRSGLRLGLRGFADACKARTGSYHSTATKCQSSGARDFQAAALAPEKLVGCETYCSGGTTAIAFGADDEG